MSSTSATNQRNHAASPKALLVKKESFGSITKTGRDVREQGRFPADLTLQPSDDDRRTSISSSVPQLFRKISNGHPLNLRAAGPPSISRAASGLSTTASSSSDSDEGEDADTFYHHYHNQRRKSSSGDISAGITAGKNIPDPMPHVGSMARAMLSRAMQGRNTTEVANGERKSPADTQRKWTHAHAQSFLLRKMRQTQHTISETLEKERSMRMQAEARARELRTKLLAMKPAAGENWDPLLVESSGQDLQQVKIRAEREMKQALAFLGLGEQMEGANDALRSIYNLITCQENNKETIQERERHEKEIHACFADPNNTDAARWFGCLKGVSTSISPCQIERLLFQVKSGTLALRQMVWMQVEELVFDSVEPFLATMSILAMLLEPEVDTAMVKRVVSRRKDLPPDAVYFIMAHSKELMGVDKRVYTDEEKRDLLEQQETLLKINEQALQVYYRVSSDRPRAQPFKSSEAAMSAYVLNQVLATHGAPVVLRLLDMLQSEQLVAANQQELSSLLTLLSTCASDESIKEYLNDVKKESSVDEYLKKHAKSERLKTKASMKKRTIVELPLEHYEVSFTAFKIVPIVVQPSEWRERDVLFAIEEKPVRSEALTLETASALFAKDAPRLPSPRPPSAKTHLIKEAVQKVTLRNQMASLVKSLLKEDVSMEQLDELDHCLNVLELHAFIQHFNLMKARKLTYLNFQQLMITVQILKSLTGDFDLIEMSTSVHQADLPWPVQRYLLDHIGDKEHSIGQTAPLPSAPVRSRSAPDPAPGKAFSRPQSARGAAEPSNKTKKPQRPQSARSAVSPGTTRAARTNARSAAAGSRALVPWSTCILIREEESRHSSSPSRRRTLKSLPDLYPSSSTQDASQRSSRFLRSATSIGAPYIPEELRKFGPSKGNSSPLHWKGFGRTSSNPQGESDACTENRTMFAATSIASNAPARLQKGTRS